MLENSIKNSLNTKDSLNWKNSLKDSSSSENSLAYCNCTTDYWSYGLKRSLNIKNSWNIKTLSSLYT